MGKLPSLVHNTRKFLGRFIIILIPTAIPRGFLFNLNHITMETASKKTVATKATANKNSDPVRQRQGKTTNPATNRVRLAINPDGTIRVDRGPFNWDFK